MVLNRDEKEDVFAGFHIGESVADNEENLNQMVERERKSALPPVDKSAFPEFKIDEIVKEHEERLRKAERERKAREEEEEGSLRPSSRGWESARSASSTIRGLGNLIRPPPFLSQRTPSKDSDDIQSPRVHSSPRGQIRNRRIAAGGDGGTVAQTINPKVHSRRHPSPNKKKQANTSRSGTTVTTSIREEDELYDNEDDEMDSLSDDDLEVGENGAAEDDGDDDDSLIVVRRGKKRNERDIITHSSTGMPIGGMVTSSTKDALSSSQPSDYHWISPHAADTIFGDFDIDTIVKDYEKMHRNITYGVPGMKGNGLVNIEEEDEGVEVLGITKRYQSIKTYWLENFPRTHGILFRILFPLGMIIGITWFLGIYLAEFEKVDEIANNDAIIRAQHKLTHFPVESLSFVADAPAACFELYYEQKVPGGRPFKNRTIFSNLDLPPISPGIDQESDPEELVSEIESYMTACTKGANATLGEYIDLKQSELEAAALPSLTFSWIRCWDKEIYGSRNPVFPTKKQLKAAVNQSEFYYEMWQQNQTALYKEYLLQENLTHSEDAYYRSVADASGEGICVINRAASAWFWFVFMTTVGYGNVSPVTTGGRIFVAVIGCITVVMWALILYIAGKVLGIIIDDMFRRVGCRQLTGNLPSVIIWGAISLGYIAFIAEQYVWWNNRTLHPGETKWTPFGLTRVTDESIVLTDINDAYWFSIISLLTVGLGDFSLGTESFFIQDLLMWTASFLVGFTFLSTFLGQIADLTNSFFPDSGNYLKERLLNTNLVGKAEVEYKRENQKGIEKLEKLVEIMDDDDADLLAQRVTRIRVKKNLLVHLLHQTQRELEHYKKRGERYESLTYAMVCKEENMLNEVTDNTRIEREKLESYRAGRSNSIEGSALPTPGSEHSYFDDGTPLDLVSKKLKLREGQKSARKTLKASWYI